MSTLTEGSEKIGIQALVLSAIHLHLFPGAVSKVTANIALYIHTVSSIVAITSLYLLMSKKLGFEAPPARRASGQVSTALCAL